MTNHMMNQAMDMKGDYMDSSAVWSILDGFLKRGFHIAIYPSGDGVGVTITRGMMKITVIESDVYDALVECQVKVLHG